MAKILEQLAKDIFKGCEYPWEVLPKIKDFIIALGENLDSNEYNTIGIIIVITNT